ncbi:MAG: Mur ligase family protein, partial [Flavobacteriaceae bacterium]|nr:Mur ligase family protein [Flavobacteriaceae bacterium]
MEISALHKLFLQTKSVSTDSRKIESNSIYFALSGERFNGNDFAINALNNGALYAVVDAAKYKDHPGCIYVADALKVLQALGTYHRNYCKAKVISLTGSNGKTTTKELIYKVLSQKYNTSATLGNLNNHIG